VVLMVDNSRSMADQQEMLSRVAGDLVAGLTAVTDDMHIGVISSSLGGHGADLCSPASGAQFDPSQNDRAHLIPTVRGSLSSYDGQGFLKWDKNAIASPAGESDASALTNALRSHILAVGEIGCGFEAQLEATYRFLVDPEPPQDVVQLNGSAVRQGVDTVVLDQRAAFLRPDSAVLIVILSEEDDCSTFDGGIGWISMQGTGSNGSQFALPKGTSACTTNPNDACCRSCNVVEQNPPAGCQPTTADPACQNPYHDDMNDQLQLRCWEQKRRFGVDFLYSVERYVEAFSSTTIQNREGIAVPNPLLAGRDPSLISIASIVGVPWQDLAKNPGDAQNLDYMTAAELRANDRWTVILGDPANHVPPSDPFMRASVEPRSGQNPITGDPIEAPTSTASNAINGNDFGTSSYAAELQYTCIYPLDSPRECGNIGA
jgi:hypothetical protein